MKAETDYTLEAANTEKMRQFLAGDPGFRVPQLARQLSSRRTLATELLPGVPLDRCVELPQVLPLLLLLLLRYYFTARG